MKTIRAHKHWLAALTGLALLVGAALVFTQQTNYAGAQQTTPEEGARHARQLSTVFRHIALKALPGVVAIQSEAKQPQLTRLPQRPFDDENSPFRRFFENDPRLREFFKEFRAPEMPRETPRRRGIGSGFVIDESGIILTNYHVVRGAERVQVKLQDGRTFEAKDFKGDPRTDVAVIWFDAPKDLHALKLGESSKMEIGDWVLAVGSPFRLYGTVTQGIISGKSRGPGITQREEFLQTDAAINPGNSGGPLLNLDGEVIGMNTAISTRTGHYDGIGFAIPIDLAKWVSRQLIEDGEVKRAYLGVGIPRPDTPVYKQLAKRFDLQPGEGAAVGQVYPGSPAAEAGLQPGDVILEVDGRKITGGNELQALVERMQPDRSYPVVIRRDDERKELSVTLKEMPEQFARGEIAQVPEEEPAGPESAVEKLGIEVQQLTPALARQLGVKAEKGVVVTSVRNGSLARIAGLESGDVIEKVGRTEVSSPEEFRKALERESLAEGILLQVQGNQGTRFVVIQSN